MMVRVLAIAMLLLPVLAACRRQPEELKPLEPQLTAEEQRLLHATSIDSTTMDRLVPPDSIDGADALDTLSAEAWLLVDDASGTVVSQKNGAERRYMASLTKMMTALMVIEDGRLGDTVRITKADCVTHDARVRPGDSYTTGNLLREMMLVSDNDAAIALARHVSGDTVAFAKLMNRKAEYLGMAGTRFDNPNGMPNVNNYSSARDLLKLTRYAMADSTFAATVATPTADIPLLDGRHLPCRNTNALLFTYEGCQGVKTGYTRQAGYCLASAATRDSTTLVLILLGSKSMAARFAESATLLDYGFRAMEAYHKAETHPLAPIWKRLPLERLGKTSRRSFY